MLKDHIESDAMTAINWFDKNQTTANADKFQSILWCRGSTSNLMVNVGGHSIPQWGSDFPKQNIENVGSYPWWQTKFWNSYSQYMPKSSRQINALKRISKILNKQCRLRVNKSIVFPNFNHCPVVWMFCGKTNLGKLERLQERALSTIFLEKSLSYNELLKKSDQSTVRMYLMRFLIIEVFKCVRDISPSYLNDMFIAPSSNYVFRRN